jgi:Ca-activated chloride channel family protein
VFSRPLLLLLLLTIPLWWWYRSRRRRPAVVYSDVRHIAAARSRRHWFAELPAALRSIALGSFVVAAAGPRAGDGSRDTTSEGITIVLAVDVSSSMLAEDFLPSNRLDVAKEQSIAFIDGREFDRIGLVAFAGEAITRIPVTVDYEVLRQAVRSMTVGELEDGTAIGTAIATAANRLRRAPGRSKVMVLLTDGENTRGVLDPRTAAEAAASFGIRIYTIGVGTEGEARIPLGRGVEGQIRYQTLPVRLDEPLLRDIADMTGGRYFRATDPEGLSRIFSQIDQLEKTPVVVSRPKHYEEAYQVPLVLGLGVLAVELLVAATVVVRVP